ncbi:hypothetical protein [Klebsiella aerogenes]
MEIIIADSEAIPNIFIISDQQEQNNTDYIPAGPELEQDSYW